MKIIPVIVLFLALLVGCKNGSNSEAAMQQNKNLVIANQFIDAFYSFDPEALRTVLAEAKTSRSGILFYQKWAECGHYEVLNRHQCIQKNDTLVVCPVTVKDDLMEALQLDLHVTDTFHLSIIDGHLKSVETSSNDPELFYEGRKWVRQHLPELVEEPCNREKQGGPTPCACIQATVQGLAKFIMAKKQIQDNP
ncbi:hypothetical protein [Aestuariivivens sediminis]|uniref:hypothetical protein n=1 Tax=Aestuariivivens sediminis TaxID=2913557 RepID=UPI001F57E9A1|nr:hypothetical protein [Aestuariivivens sediminis]